jgi:hypothetical protein
VDHTHHLEHAAHDWLRVADRRSAFSLRSSDEGHAGAANERQLGAVEHDVVTVDVTECRLKRRGGRQIELTRKADDVLTVDRID